MNETEADILNINAFKIKYGFSSYLVTTLLISLIFALAIQSPIRSIFGLISFLSGLFIVVGYSTTIGSGWQPIHFRGLEMYKITAKLEWDNAVRASRSPNVMKAISDVCQFLGGYYAVNSNKIEEIHSRWITNKKSTLTLVASKHLEYLFPGVPPNKHSELVERFSELNPQFQLVVAGFVEHLHGEEQTALYLKALIKGEAKGID